ncbi:MFS transporter [Corynebacterium ulceribovis]|uniref:MFS transporter n=1 Tax=Corynebacterium ulceribovis TaxID=487732 RepID=UPI0003618181|nr:MFS transporter [Corynebacterium ulceribovis]
MSDASGRSLSRDERSSARKLVAANGLQATGDQILGSKTVLPWLFVSLGVPTFFLALLTPIRESGSMLPQAALTPWLTARAKRVPVWVWGSHIQGAMVVVMAVAALTLTGAAAGVVILLALAVFSLGRALCSLSGKDVQGRVIAKGHRGRITGRATVISGWVAIAVGALLAIISDITTPVVVALLGVAAVMWFLAGTVFGTIKDNVPDDFEPVGQSKWLSGTWHLFRDNTTFRNFVVVRSLLLVSALAPPFVVALATERADGVLSGLGLFLVASGLASVVGGFTSGKASDRSSRKTMMRGALSASIVIIVLIASSWWLPTSVNIWLLPIAFFLLNVSHAEVRVARKTYIIDMAEGDERTLFVASANTAMGIVLLIAGALSGVLASFGTMWALAFLAAMGFVGVAMSARLPEVSAPQDS